MRALKLFPLLLVLLLPLSLFAASPLRGSERVAEIKADLCLRLSLSSLSLHLPLFCQTTTPPPPPSAPTPVPVVPPPTPEPEPEPIINHLIITEVYYDTASTTAESDGPNEWIEIYNGTGASVNITGWTVGDATASSSDVLATTTIAHNSFIVITSSSTTLGFWSIPASSTILVLPNLIGSNGLSNTGDAVYLKNPLGILIDAVSYGTNTTVVNPAATDVPDGHSLKRTSLSTDTDTAGDWVDASLPNPGAF